MNPAQKEDKFEQFARQAQKSSNGNLVQPQPIPFVKNACNLTDENIFKITRNMLNLKVCTLNVPNLYQMQVKLLYNDHLLNILND